MNKSVTRLLDGLHIDMKGLKAIKEMTEKDRKTKIVLMPMFKSFSDLFILHYANYISDIEMGFRIDEDSIVEINFNANDMESLCDALNNADVIED